MSVYATQRQRPLVLLMVVCLLGGIWLKSYITVWGEGQLTLNVNTTVDAPDVNVGDGVCATAANQCTLRAARGYPCAVG